MQPLKKVLSLEQNIDNLWRQIEQDIHLELVNKAKANNRSAQYELYHLYSKAMLNVSYRIVNDLHEAEDCTAGIVYCCF